MKKIVVVFSVVVLCLSFFVGCGDNKKAVTNVAKYEDCVLELKDAIKTKDKDGNNIVRVKAVFTNKTEKPLYGSSCFVVKAFQNDKKLKEVTDINGKDKNLTVEIKNGKNIEVSYAFKLVSDKEVEVLIGTPTADEETIGKKVYFSHR